MSDEYEGLSPTFADACRAADKEFGMKPSPIKSVTVTVPHSTLMAATYLLHLGDRERLKRFLAEHSHEQQMAILALLERRNAQNKS